MEPKPIWQGVGRTLLSAALEFDVDFDVGPSRSGRTRST